MRLSELCDLIREQSDDRDPEIRLITQRAPFLSVPKVGDNIDICHRKKYYDDTFFGSNVPKGDFVVLDFM